WNPQGTRYAICSDGRLTVIGDSGSVVLSTQLTSDEDEIVKTLGWAASGQALIFELGVRLSLTETPGKLRRLDLRASPPAIFDYDISFKSKFNMEVGEVLGMGNESGTVIRTAAGAKYRLNPDEVQIAHESGEHEWIAASPSGRYRMAKGPVSRHHHD